MDYNSIKALLDKYWEGETSIEEEAKLRAYFASDQVAEDLESFRPLFDFFGSEQQIQIHRDIQLPKTIYKTIRSGRSRRLQIIRSIAATLLIALGFFYYVGIHQKQQAMDTYENPEIAYEEAVKALQYLSGKMNKGIQTTSYSLEKMKPLDDILN